MEREEKRMNVHEKYKTGDIEQSEQNTRLIFMKHNKTLRSRKEHVNIKSKRFSLTGKIFHCRDQNRESLEGFKSKIYFQKITRKILREKQ